MATHAIVADHPGGPDVLKLQDVPIPVPANGELLVKTGAVGVNFVEIYQREGIYPVDFPFTPGSEGAGTVEAVGDGVAGFMPGDRIATCEGVGTYADYFLVPADAAAKIPDDVSIREAGALPLQGCTAHYLINSSSHPTEGDTVLVHAGAGGVGQLITQMLKRKGVRVITTASTEEKRALSRAAGADLSIGYEDFPAVVREFTDGRGVDVVYDGVGKSTFDGSLASLRIRGEMVLFGGASGQVPLFDLQRLNREGSLSVTRPYLDHFMLTPEERQWRYTELFEAVQGGTLKVKIGAEFPLAEAGSAQTQLEGRKTTGKVLLHP